MKKQTTLCSVPIDRQMHHSVNILRPNQVTSFKNPLTAQITAHKLDSILSETNEMAIFAVKKKIPSGNGKSIYHPLSLYTAETVSVVAGYN